MSETTGLLEIDSRVFRDVLGHYPTGVVAVTAKNAEGAPIGMVMGTFSSVSLDPPLVSFMPMKTSASYAALRDCDTLVINVLAHDQQQETRTLAQRDPEKFDRVDWELSAHGAPMIRDAVAHIHCSITQEVDAGDHLIVLCAVRDVQVTRPVTPLLFFQGGYGGFSATASAAHVDPDLISAVRVAEVARPQLTTLADRFDCEAVALVQINDHDQTIGASARSTSVHAHERLGVRLALVPPMGDVAVAWDEQQTQRWLARIFPPDPEVIAAYSRRLDAVRNLGYSVHVLPEGREDDHRQFTEALHEYALGQLTPARDRAVRGVIASAADFYLTEEVAAHDTVRVVSLTVPVFGVGEEVHQNSGLTLRLSFEPTLMTGAEISQRARALQTAAQQVQASFAGDAAVELERYRGSGLLERA